MAEDITSENQSFLNPSRRSYVYESSRNSGNRTRIILIIVGIIILIALIGFAVFATGGKGEADESISPTTEVPTEAPQVTEEAPTPADETPTVTPKTTPTPGKGTPTPTADSDLEREDLSIAVQNGSGVSGAATKASDILKDLGYDVVSSGNADNFDYEKMVIQVTSSKKAYLQMLKDDLSDSYTIGSATADYTGTDADALVIVGKE